MNQEQKLTEEQLANLKAFLSLGRADFVDPMNPHGHFNKFKYASTYEQVNDNEELALLIVQAYPELIYKVSEGLRANPKFIYEATDERHSQANDFIYKHSSDEIKDQCGQPQDAFMSRILSSVLNTATPEEQWKSIRKNLAQYAKTQEEREALSRSLSAAARSPAPKFRFKI